MTYSNRDADIQRAQDLVRRMQPQLLEACEKGIETYKTQDISLCVWEEGGGIKVAAGPREKVRALVAGIMGDGAVIDQFEKPCEGGYWLAVKLIGCEGVGSRMRRLPLPQA